MKDALGEDSEDIENETGAAVNENGEDIDELQESLLVNQVELKPPLQFGLNSKNLDHVYAGHSPYVYRMVLRKWIWGVNGLAYDMILPAKNVSTGRNCAAVDKMLTFFFVS